MTDSKGSRTEGKIPGSVYSFLLDAKKMADPFYGDNELAALELMKEDYTFTRTFTADPGLLANPHQLLRFDGIDTLAEIFLNDTRLGNTDNMHLCWEYDVKGLLKPGENTLKVCIQSPTKYIAEKDSAYHLGGSTDAMRGFPHLRKAHCMFGWDWGPRLPDQGIWRDVTLLGWEDSRIEEIKITQLHTFADGSPAMDAPGHAEAARNRQIVVAVTVEVVHSGSLPVQITLEAPDGKTWSMDAGKPFSVPDPKLWWPNGLGDQPLYTITVNLCKPSSVLQAQSQQSCSTVNTVNASDLTTVDTAVRKIGLRTMTMRRRPDDWGETFATEVNGRTFFAMGADYIPEDNILSRMNPERTRKLLEDCRLSHFNAIRVWGGGFYPADWFYDFCDELGLVVWQDFMFACANYRITKDFVKSIREEIRQNVRRIRHHASLGLWCGNNEMEQFAKWHVYDGDDITAADYLVQNEFIIPEVLSKEDPQTFYWPSSPSSGGKFDAPEDPNRGDVHYWAVWHEGVPFTAYREYNFRYLSEFGFQSFPCLETVKSFAPPKEQNIFSYTMEMHQRNTGANGKILQYLSATYRYPTDFELLLYASQLLQAEAIRYGVEHFRRNRSQDRCMGAVYWQLNDIWPVASWASMDYYYRWKALQYYAVRFFSPVLLTCEETSVVSQGRTCVDEPAPVQNIARLNLTNETWETVTDVAEWELRDQDSNILKNGELPVQAEPFSAVWLAPLDFSDYDYRTVHLTYRLRDHDSSGSVLFAPPKHYRFADPHLRLAYNEQTQEVTVYADAYAKSVEIYSKTGYIRLTDNFFDMEKGKRTVKLLEGNAGELCARSVYNI